MKDFCEKNAPGVVIFLFCVLIGLFVLAGFAMNDYHTRAMADKGFCYHEQDIINNSGDHWTWEKCK